MGTIASLVLYAIIIGVISVIAYFVLAKPLSFSTTVIAYFVIQMAVKNALKEYNNEKEK